MTPELLRLGRNGVVPVRWELSKADSDPGTLTGWASVYNVIDQQDDVVVPGAFKKSLQEWRQSKRVIALTMDHENGVRGVIGSLTNAQDTPYGLKTTFKFASTDDAQTARLLAKEGHVAGLSIFGAPIQREIQVIEDRPIRVLREVALMAVGLTPIPANAASLVTAAKAAKVSTEDYELPDVWVSDMRAALTITAPAVRKSAVLALVNDFTERIAAAQDATTEPDTTDDTGGTEDVPSTQDDADIRKAAAEYALSVIGEGPRDGAPSGEPSDSLDALMAQVHAQSTSDELDALAAELEGRL